MGNSCFKTNSIATLIFLVVFRFIASSNAEDTTKSSFPEFVLQWGSNGAGPGEFHSPICIAITDSDEVFVADLNNARIQQFTTEGTFVSEFALPLDDEARKQSLIGGMAVDQQSNLYLSFMMQHKIAVYKKSGELVRQWGAKGSGDGEFFQPGGVVLRSNGNVLVADQCNHRIQEFTSLGEFVGKWGEHGAELGQFGGPEPAGSRFAGPHFLAQDSQGRLYTTEAALGRIQQFDERGKAMASWGSKTVEPGAFGEYQFGNLKNSFGPIGIFADRHNRIWVSSLNDRVQCFEPNGEFVCRLNGVDEADTFTHPHGIAQDKHNCLYIADSGNQRIVKFKLPER